jgi:hypothetical protein
MATRTDDQHDHHDDASNSLLATDIVAFAQRIGIMLPEDKGKRKTSFLPMCGWDDVAEKASARDDGDDEDACVCER